MNVKTLALLLCCLAATPALGQTVIQAGTFGRTYAIAEPDIIDEITALAEAADWGRMTSGLKDGFKKAAARATHLPHATSDRSFLFEPSYTLDVDIRDRSGQVVYPAGFTFNPLKYSPLPSLYVVLDGSAPEQVAWLRSTDYYKNMRVKVVLSGGVQTDLAKPLGTTPALVDKMFLSLSGVVATPSVVVQEGDKLRIYEVYVPRQPRGKKK